MLRKIRNWKRKQEIERRMKIRIVGALPEILKLINRLQ